MVLILPDEKRSKEADVTELCVPGGSVSVIPLRVPGASGSRRQLGRKLPLLKPVAFPWEAQICRAAAAPMKEISSWVGWEMILKLSTSDP